MMDKKSVVNKALFMASSLRLNDLSPPDPRQYMDKPKKMFLKKKGGNDG